MNLLKNKLKSYKSLLFRTAVSVCFLLLIGQNTYAQLERFSPSKSINIQSFKITDLHTIVVIDANQKCYYSTGSTFKKLETKNKFLDFIPSQNTILKTKDFPFTLIDTSYYPRLSTEQIDIAAASFQLEKQFYSINSDNFLGFINKDTIPYLSGTNDICIANSTLYAATDHGIKVYQNNNWKTFSIPTINQGKAIQFVDVANNRMVAVTINDIHFFDTETYDFNDYYTSKPISDVQLDTDGNIWVLSKGDLFYIRRTESISSKYSIGEVKVDHRVMPIGELVNLTPQQGQIELVIDKRNLIETDRVKHYYMMEGIDDAWKTTEESSISYNLSPGKYGFKIKTETAYKSEISKPIPILIKEQIDNTWLFVIGGFAAFLLLFTFLQNYRHKNAINTLNSQIKLLQTKARLSKTENKLNQLRINPHFLFNSLNNIQGLLVSDEKAKARTQLRNFSLLMRQVLDSNDTEKITIAEDIKFLKQYLELEKMNHGGKFDYSITVDQDLVDSILIPPMITQIPVENAVIHGMKTKTNGGKISIHYSLFDTSTLVITITDNGPGLSNIKSDHISKGTTIILDRLKNTNDPYSLKNREEEGQITGCIATLKIKI